MVYGHQLQYKLTRSSKVLNFPFPSFDLEQKAKGLFARRGDCMVPFVSHLAVGMTDNTGISSYPEKPHKGSVIGGHIYMTKEHVWLGMALLE
jgi:hypothetical protein